MENDKNLNTEGEICTETRIQRIPHGLAVMVAILALVTLVLMLMLIASTQNGNRDADSDTATVTKTKTEGVLDSNIDVKQVTPYMTENQGAQEALVPVTTDEPEPSDPEPTTVSSSTSSSSPKLDVDEDVAAVLAESAGFTPVSVYVFTDGAVDSGDESPRSGLVLLTEEYVGRTNGEAFRFLNVQTSEPTSKAKTVPNVVGKAWKTARAELAAAGLGIRYQYEYDSPDTFGNVIFQSPAPGTYMPRGSSVVVVLAN